MKSFFEFLPEEKHNYLQKLFHEDGYSISRTAKNLHINKDEAAKILYGETLLENIQKIFFNDIISPYMKDKKHFCDLGSGTGNVVISLAMLNVFESYSGVELLEYLWQYSCLKKDIFIHDFENFNNKIHFHNTNILNFDLSKFDVLFINYPFSDSEQKEVLKNKLETELEEGSIVIFGIEGVDSEKLEIIDSVKFNFSWGEGTCKYYIKV